MNNQFWHGKRVFLTGHTGFKGGWLALWLNHWGADVYGYALAPITQPSLFDAANIADQCHSTLGDICDKTALNNALTASQADIVFHLAAQPIVRESYQNPLATLETNVLGTANVLEAVRQCPNVKAVLVVTSDKCYLNKEWQWGYREDEALGGHDPYSASKACTELVAQSWQKSFFSDNSSCAIATARAGNVIGGGDWSKDRLIPDVLDSLRMNQPVILRNPDAIRPWQHVLEPLAGYLKLAQKLYEEGLPWAQAWNFGPFESDTQTVSKIVEQLIAERSGEGQWKTDGENQPHEAQLLKLDSSKARQVLGWKNHWTIQDCVREIANWDTQFRSGADMQEFSLQTITRYLAAEPR